jgi:hypothetical protein
MPKSPPHTGPVGSGLPACRRASTRRGAGVRKLLRQHREPSLDRIPFDMVLPSQAFLIVRNHVVVAFVLPTGDVVQPEHPNSLKASEAFERSKPFSRWHMGGDEKMDMVRHHDKRVSFIALESAFACVEGFNKHFGNLWFAEEHWTALGMVQQTIHGYKRLSGGKARVRKHPARRKTSVQTESHEHTFSNDVPVRKTPVAPAHMGISTGRNCIVSGDSVTACAGRRPRGRSEALTPLSRLVGLGWVVSG